MESTIKFLGPEQILSVIDTGTNTYRGEKIVEVITQRQGSDDKTRVTTMTEKGLTLVMTDTATDWNYLQDTKLEAVVKILVNTATDYGVNGGELSPLLSRLGAALASRFEQAAHIRFEGNDDEFVPGGNECQTWSLAKAESIIVNSKPNVTAENNA